MRRVRGGGVRHGDLAAGAVEFKDHVACAVLVAVAEPQVLYDQGLAVLYVYRGSFTLGQAVEEHMAAHAHDIAVLLAVREVVLHDLRVHGVGDEALAVRVGCVFFNLGADGVPVDGRQEVARAAGDGLFALEYHALQILREAAGRLAHHALEVAHDAVREGEGLAALYDVLRRQVVLYHEYCEVAYHLGAGRDLDDVAEHVVDGAVHLLDLVEALAEAEGLNLGLEVGVLAAGYLVAVDVRDGGTQSLVEAAVALAHVAPVVGELLQALGGQAGVALRAAHGLDKAVEARLAGEAGQGPDGAVDHIHASLGGKQVGGNLVVGGVVGVQVDGHADLFLERLDELLGRVRLQQAAHVLYTYHVRAAPLELLGEVDVVLERVAVALGVEDIAGVADGGLEYLARPEHGLHGRLHAGYPVKRVKDAEHVDAVLRALLDEGVDEVVGIAGVADEVGAAQQHLEGDVGYLLAQHDEPLPGGLVEETVGGVKGGPAPHLQREAVGEEVRRTLRALDHVAGAHAGGEQALVCVAHRGVRYEQLLLLHDPAADRLGTLSVQQLLEAVGAGYLAGGHRIARGGVLAALRVRVRNLDVRYVAQHARGAVAALLYVEELRRLVDELGVALARDEGRVVEYVRDEGDVGLDAADMLLVDGAARLAAHGLEGAVPGGDLDQQAVVVGAYLGAGRRVAAVEAHAEAAAGAVGHNLAVVGREVVLRILSRDAALDGVAVHVEVALFFKPYLRVSDRRSLGYEYLRAHYVDAGDHFGDGVLDLDARVHLDEVVMAVAVDQKLDRAGVHIADGLGNPDRVGAQRLAHLFRHAPGRAELHHLLIAALQRAVALAQVAHVAMLVGENLHLYVLGLDQVLLHEDAVVAEGLAGLVADELKRGGHVLKFPAQAHAAPAAASRRLQDHGEAELLRPGLGLGSALQRLFCSRNNRNAAGNGNFLGLELVAHLGQHMARRADELDARVLAGLGKGRVLAQEAVAGVDGVHAALLGQRYYLIYGEVGAERAQVLAYQIGLVRLRAEEVHHVLFRVYGHGAQSQVITGPEYAYGNLAAVRGHYLPESVKFLQFNHLLSLISLFSPQLEPRLSPRSIPCCGACWRCSRRGRPRGNRARPGR